MRITIDTKTDSSEEIKLAINLLNDLLKTKHSTSETREFEFGNSGFSDMFSDDKKNVEEGNDKDNKDENSEFGAGIELY